MFEHCNTLAELNGERQRLVRVGESVAKVNAAYNRAKKELLDAVPSYRHIPTYIYCDKTEASHYVALPFLKQKGKPNEIIITMEGVIL